jgi:uncharacterized protein YgiM (DUF1202 family)
MVLLAVPLSAGETFFSIKTKKVAVRSESDYLSKVIGQLDYNAKVQLIEAKGNWSKIGHEDTQGWIPSSTLSPKNVSFDLSSEQPKEKKKKSAFGFGSMFKTDTKVSADEVAMAGKAWEADIPLEGGGNYDAVDAMENITISVEEKIEYLKTLEGGEQ